MRVAFAFSPFLAHEREHIGIFNLLFEVLIRGKDGLFIEILDERRVRFSGKDLFFFLVIVQEDGGSAELAAPYLGSSTLGERADKIPAQHGFSGCVQCPPGSVVLKKLGRFRGQGKFWLVKN